MRDMCVLTHMWKFEDNLLESESHLESHQVGHEDQTQVTRLGGEPLCRLSHLVRPILELFGSTVELTC